MTFPIDAAMNAALMLVVPATISLAILTDVAVLLAWLWRVLSEAVR
jgi:hypothetical protein